MAERRCSAHADVEQSDGGTLSARKPRDPLSIYNYIEQCIRLKTQNGGSRKT